MAYMKKNVNFGFFLLLVASLICLAGVSIYYQTTFKNLYLDYKDKIDELSNLSSTLISERNRLNQTSYQLMVKQEREEELSSQYSSLKDEKDLLQSEKSKLSSQLSSRSAELAQKKAELAAAQAELISTKKDLSDASSTISGLRTQISELNEEVDSLTVQLAACQNS